MLRSRPIVYGCSGSSKIFARVHHLDDLAHVHHGHAVGHLGDHAQVVGDHQDRHAEVGLELLQQLQDLGLDRHVERRRRLVGDQQARIAGQRHRDHRPLAHAAGELVRILVEALLRIADADRSQHLDGALVGVASC